MAKPKVLLLGKIDHKPALRDWAALSEYADLLIAEASGKDEFYAKCKNGDYDGVTVIYRTFDSFKLTGMLDKNFLDSFPKSLNFICHNGAGYDQIDIQACTESNVYVSNVPTAVDDATADTAVFLTLGMLRNFPISIAALKNGDWRGKTPPGLGHDPQGKTLGILGMGGIGRNYAAKMRVFGMNVIYHNRKPLSDADADGAKYVSFEELLRTSDVLSLNLPLNAKTRGIIGKSQLEMMKESAIVVNTARGAVIDEEALIEALDKGVIAGAGLDVYSTEPQVPKEIYENDKIMILPHMGTWTVETQTKMEQWVIENMKSALLDKTLKSRVGEQASLPEVHSG